MARCFRFLLSLLLLLAAAPSVYAQGPANDLCANDDRACHQGRADAMWLELWGQVPDTTSGLVIEPTTSALGLDSAGQWRVSARRGTEEVGSGSFIEAAGGRRFISHNRQTHSDGTPVDVTFEWVVGTLSGAAGGSRGILGVVVTIEIPGLTTSVLRPVATDPDLSAALGRSRPLLFTEASRKRDAEFLVGDQPLPPSYDYFNCLIEPSVIDEACGQTYCGCLGDALASAPGAEISCVLSLTAAILGCLPANIGGPAAFIACVVGTVGTGVGCIDTILAIGNEFAECRSAADRCYCNEFPEYPYLCGNETLSVEVSGLRLGESVRVNGTCRAYGAPNGVSNSALATSENAFFDLLQCGTHQEATITAESVSTPGTPSGQGRRCFSVGPPIVNRPVPAGGEIANFDCTCQTLDECRQGRVSLEMQVSGLPTPPPAGGHRIEIRGYAEYTDESGALASIQVAGVANGNGTFLFEPQLYSGLRLTWQGSQSLPPGCRVTYLVPSGSTLPATTPDQTVLRAAEVTCETCQDPGGCGEIDVQVSVSGVTRPGGVSIQTLIGGTEVVHSQLTDGTTTVTHGQPGESYQVLVNQPYKQLGPNSVEYCDATQATSNGISTTNGVLPDTSPFVAANIECTTETNKLRPQSPPGGGGSLRWPACSIAVLICLPDYGRPCSDPNPYGECAHTVSGPCYVSCLGGGSLGAVRVQRADSTVSISGDQPPGATPITDDHLTVSAQASDEDGIQGFVFAIDGIYVGEHVTGGHTAVSSGPIEIDTSGLSEGPHTFEVYALDNHPDMPAPSIAGIPFEVRRADPCAGDSAGPTLGFSAPIGGGPLPLAALDVYAEASDPRGVDYVQFYVDGAYQSSDGNWPYRFHWSPQPGPHTLRARAADGCGNITEVDAPVVVTDPCGALPYPEVAITNLTDGAWLPPALYHIEAQATDHSGLGISSVTFQAGDLASSTDTSAPWSSTGYFLTTQGPVPIVARAFDDCGRMAQQEITIHIDSDSSVCGIDQGPPVVTIAQPVSGTNLPAGPTTITAQAVEDTVLFAWALWVDGRPVDTALVGTASYQWTRDLGPGSHTIEVRAADVCMKTGRAAVSVTVGSSPQPFAWLGFEPYLRFLDGPTNPPGPPVENDRLVDFGAILPGQPGNPRTISLLNDGAADLEITGIQITGKAFEVVSGGGSQTVPGWNGERFLSVRPTGAGDGVVEGTLTLEASGSGGTFTRRLRVNVDPIDGDPSRFSTQSYDFESGTLVGWTGVYGVAPAVTKGSALAGERGMDVSFVGVTAQSFVHAALPAPKALVRTFFRFDPNSVAWPGGAIESIAAYVSTGTPIAWLQVRQVTGGYEARVVTRRDDGSSALSAWITLSDAPERLTLDWWAASGPGTDNGGARLRRADGTTSEVRGLDNDQQRSEQFRLGALWGVVDAMEGNIFFDDVMIQY